MKTSGNQTTLIRRLINLKHKDGNNMVEYINSFKGIVNELVAMKMNIDDEMQTSLLLNSLLDGWETLVVTIKDSFLNEEARRKEKG